MSVNEFYTTIYQPHLDNNISHKTVRTRTNILNRYLIESYGSSEINDITKSDINNIYDQAEQNGLKRNTIFGIYAALSSFFRLAMKRNLTTSNPVAEARRIRPSTKYKYV